VEAEENAHAPGKTWFLTHLHPVLAIGLGLAGRMDEARALLPKTVAPTGVDPVPAALAALAAALLDALDGNVAPARALLETPEGTHPDLTVVRGILRRVYTGGGAPT